MKSTVRFCVTCFTLHPLLCLPSLPCLLGLHRPLSLDITTMCPPSMRTDTDNLTCLPCPYSSFLPTC